MNGAHKAQPRCRICGSSKLNKLYYALELSNKIGLYQVLRRDGSLDQLIRPCECRADFAHAHKICLANWIETTKHEYCDICRSKYNVSFLERSVFDWIFETRQLESLLKVLSATLLIYYLGALGILVCRGPQSRRNILDMMILSTSYIWIVACTLILVAYCVHTAQEFRQWRSTHRQVIVEENVNPQLDSEPIDRDVLKSSGFSPFLPREDAKTTLPESGHHSEIQQSERPN